MHNPSDRSFTVFWSHPFLGQGHFVSLSHYGLSSAREIAEMASKELPEGIVDCDDDVEWEEQVDGVREEMEVKVYFGRHDAVPSCAPAYAL